MAERSKANVSVGSLLGIEGSNPAEVIDILFEFCVLPDFCDGPIPRPELSYALWRVYMNETRKPKFQET